jgi:hypothetical protein
MEALMPKRVQPRWGRLGMVCVRGASQTDDDMVERGITPGEYGRGDRGCRFSDKQLDSLVVHLNSSGVSIPPDRCGGTVVTQERLKPNAAKIPNVCGHFGTACTTFEGFLKAKGWSF